MKNKKTTARIRAKKNLRRKRPIHQRILLHPAGVFLLLCIGVLIAGWTLQGFAATIDVTGKVLAQIPGSAAEITSPADQTHFTSAPITVSGTCPSNTYVKLYRNNNFSGVATCGASDTNYQIETDLSPGPNSLFARVFSVTDDEGPQSQPITIWYDPPPVAAETSSGTAPTISPRNNQAGITARGSSSAGFFIISDYHYQVYSAGEPVSWNMALSGGQHPYAVTILWGDGDESTIVRDDQSAFSIKHTYGVKGAARITYKVKISAVDSSGATAFLQTIVIVNGSQAAGGAAAGSSSGGVSILPNARQWLWIVGPCYVTVVLMAISYWLGERQEYLNLTKAARPKRRRHA